MGYSVSLHSYGPDSEALAGLFREELQQRGVRADPFSSATDGPVIIIFTESGPGLFELVRKTNRSGQSLVLAVAEGSTGLPEGLAWRLLRAGAVDVLKWDRDGLCCQLAIARIERWLAVKTLVESPIIRKNLIGESTAWRSLLRRVVEVACFSHDSVLLLGESGTGKELLARLIHTLDERPDKKDLVVLDCTTVVPELSGSEFFGHERGAFTGAVSARDGAFALANGGTLFLDEVGELPPSLQAQLLRVIQEGTYKRVGGNSWRQTRFRLVSATNRDLPGEVATGKFRADLYYRLATWAFRVPPLQDRREDIVPLVRHFLALICKDHPAPELDELVQRHLISRDYPGNVRDLKQLVQRISHRRLGGGPVTLGCIPEDERPQAELAPVWPDPGFVAAIRQALAMGIGLKDISQAAAETAIAEAVAGANGNLQRAATQLGVTDRALQLRRAAARPSGNGAG